MPEILFEFQALGQSVRVVAIDSKSGLEAVLIVPRGSSDKTMKLLAMKKLKYVQEKLKNK